MRYVLIVFSLFLLPLAHALTLEEALQSAQSRPDAVTANLELLNARNNLIRTEGDPLALKMDLVQAQQAVELNIAKFQQAYYGALLEIAQAYTGVLQAQAQTNLAEKGLAVSQESLRIAEIRLNNGSATELDYQEAQVSVQEAEKNVAAARSGLNIAENNLEGMIGQDVIASELEPVPDSFFVTLPPLEVASEAIRNHPQLLQARQGLELAGLGVSLLDPSYASESQIESARTQLETTEQLVAEAERGFNLQVRNLYIQAENAADTYRVEQDSLANAVERLQFEQDRLNAGLIAGIQFQAAEISYMQAELAALQARHAYLTALLALQEGTMVQLDGPEVLDFEAMTSLSVPAGDAEDGND